MLDDLKDELLATPGLRVIESAPDTPDTLLDTLLVTRSLERAERYVAALTDLRPWWSCLRYRIELADPAEVRAWEERHGV